MLMVVAVKICVYFSCRRSVTGAGFILYSRVCFVFFSAVRFLFFFPDFPQLSLIAESFAIGHKFSRPPSISALQLYFWVTLRLISGLVDRVSVVCDVPTLATRARNLE